MAALLDEAMQHGALGLSTNNFDSDPDSRPVPSKLADDEELIALLDVLARHKGGIVQIITNLLEPGGMVAELEHMAKLCKPRGVRIQFSAVFAEVSEAKSRETLMDYINRATKEGVDIWAIYGARPLTVQLNFERTQVFNLQGAYAWDDLVNKVPREQKIATLSNPEWRAKARHEWDNLNKSAVLDTIDHFLIDSENGVGPLDIELGDYAKQRGLHKSDAMAEWVIANGIGSTVREPGRPIDEKAVVDFMRHPTMVTGADDAGAHSQLFCGAGEPVYLLTNYVRDKALIPIEEVVHALTEKQARHYSLPDRGTLAPGRAADIAVFALDEIQYHSEKRVVDVPDGNGGMSWRYSRPPAPMRATIVNGDITYEAGKGYSGVLPGTLVGPS